MTTPDLIRILIPLRAAFEYAISAQAQASQDDRDYYVRIMLLRLKDAAENAGIIEAKQESKKAA
jgi:hypothetical protein